MQCGAGGLHAVRSAYRVGEDHTHTGDSPLATIKGIQEAKMHFYRISDSQKNTFSVAVDLQKEFYIINAWIIYQFVL